LILAGSSRSATVDPLPQKMLVDPDRSPA